MPTTRRLRPILVLLVALVAVGGVAAIAVSRLPACTFVPAGGCTRVLFIGNSYTAVNDLPATFARLAASGGHHVETGMIAPGGSFLSDAVADPEVAKVIAGTAWSAVVLQEQSQRPASPSESGAMFLPAASRLASLAVAAGAKPLLLETWAHREGWPELGQDYAAMQAAIDRSYQQAAAQTGAALVPVGEVWQRVHAADPSLALWHDDGSHPSPAGTYLAACVLYRSLFGQSPVGLADREGLSDAVAAELQQAAAGSH